MNNQKIIATKNEAIELAEQDANIRLHKYADPMEDAREDITADQAREVAKEDPSLIYATR